MLDEFNCGLTVAFDQLNLCNELVSYMVDSSTSYPAAVFYLNSSQDKYGFAFNECQSDVYIVYSNIFRGNQGPIFDFHKLQEFPPASGIKLYHSGIEVHNMP